MKVLGLSLITNKVINTPYRDIKAEMAKEYADKKQGKETVIAEEKGEEVTSHEEVLETGRQAAEAMSSLVKKIVGLAAGSL
jgi:purine-nucleoside phosphorylase